MSNDSLLDKLNSVDKIAQASKRSRLLHNPYKYIYAILFRELFYARNHKKKIVNTNVFFGGTMTIALPAATDIYLTGGKSHSSEIRLARFLIKNLNPGAHFIDIGAHYGYFSLLAERLVGAGGQVYSFEPAADSFNILSKNCQNKKNITCFREAVSDKVETISFYQFPNMYSEYNSVNIEQFENEDWFKNNKPEKISVNAKNLDAIIEEFSITPRLIKIDVEGAEYKTISGGARLFQNQNPAIVMEYLSAERGNENHRKAMQQLYDWGYKSFRITPSGALQPVNNMDSYLQEENLESDNIVFKK